MSQAGHQSLTIDFWSAALSGVGEIEAAKASKINTAKTLATHCTGSFSRLP